MEQEDYEKDALKKEDDVAHLDPSSIVKGQTNDVK